MTMQNENPSDNTRLCCSSLWIYSSLVMIILQARATTEATGMESLIAQLRAQSKLTTPRHENQKIRHENEILKVNEPTHVPTHVQIYQIIPKTYHQIS
jgi:hypothetical protein